MNRMDKMSDSKITKRTHYGGQALQFRVSNLGLLSVFGHSGFGFGVLPKRTHFRLVSLVCIRGSTPIFTQTNPSLTARSKFSSPRNYETKPFNRLYPCF